MIKIILFCGATLFSSAWGALTPAQEALYTELASGAEPAFTKKLFAELINDETTESDWRNKPLATITQKYSQLPIDTSMRARSFLGMAPSDPLESAEKFYKTLSVKIHPDKIWNNFIIKKHEQKISSLPIDIQKILETKSKELGTALFKALQDARKLLSEKNVQPTKSPTLIPPNTTLFGVLSENIPLFTDKDFADALKLSSHIRHLNEYYQKQSLVSYPEEANLPFESQEPLEKLLSWALALYDFPEKINNEILEKLNSTILLGQNEQEFLDTAKQEFSQSIAQKNLPESTKKVLLERFNEVSKNLLHNLAIAWDAIQNAHAQFDDILNEIVIEQTKKQHILKTSLQELLNPGIKKFFSENFPISADELTLTFEKLADLAGQKNAPAAAATLRLLMKFAQQGTASAEGFSDLYKQILPLVESRIHVYEAVLKNPKISPLEDSLKAKNLEMLVDLVAHTAYMRGIVPELEQVRRLGLLVNNSLETVLDNFFMDQMLTRLPEDISEEEFKKIPPLERYKYQIAYDKKKEQAVLWFIMNAHSKFDTRYSLFKNRYSALNSGLDKAIMQAIHCAQALENVAKHSSDTSCLQRLKKHLEWVIINNPSLATKAKKKFDVLEKALRPVETLTQFAQSLQALSTKITL